MVNGDENNKINFEIEMSAKVPKIRSQDAEIIINQQNQGPKVSWSSLRIKVETRHDNETFTEIISDLGICQR